MSLSIDKACIDTPELARLTYGTQDLVLALVTLGVLIVIYNYNHAIGKLERALDANSRSSGNRNALFGTPRR